MTRAEVIAVLALLVSIVSVGFSIYFNIRDRGRLKATSKFYEGREGPSYIVMTILNLGRRPIILRMWGGVDKNGEWAGAFIESQKSGLRLGEHERHAITLEKDDLYFSTPDADMILVDLWVEDLLGRRHTVKDAKENVKRLWNA